MQSNTQARVGYGQGFIKPAETVKKKAVRVRTGATVQRGEFVGSDDQPRAFVWKDEIENVPVREIIVQVAQDGFLWEDGKPLDLKVSFPEKKAIAKLQPAFADWQRIAIKQASISRLNRFWWGRFHEEGICLARRLQALLLDDAVIRYMRPIDDPACRFGAEIDL